MKTVVGASVSCIIRCEKKRSRSCSAGRIPGRRSGPFLEEAAYGWRAAIRREALPADERPQRVTVVVLLQRQIQERSSIVGRL